MYHPTTGYELSTNHQADLRQEGAENRLAQQGEAWEASRREGATGRFSVNRVVLALARSVGVNATRFGIKQAAGHGGQPVAPVAPLVGSTSNEHATSQ